MRLDSRLSSFARCFALACLLTQIVPLAYPQSSTGSVRGTVRDQSEAIVPNAVVTLTNSATNATSKSMTNESGSYVFPAVIPGDYSLRIESAGLQKYEAKLTVLVQQSATIDATLKVAAEAATVSVTDVTPVVVTDRPDLGHVLERQRIEQLPINGRSITNLL